MTEFTFEIKLTQGDLEGDEFWEECEAEDDYGVKLITEALYEMMLDYKLIKFPDIPGNYTFEQREKEIERIKKNEARKFVKLVELKLNRRT